MTHIVYIYIPSLETDVQSLPSSYFLFIYSFIVSSNLYFVFSFLLSLSRSVPVPEHDVPTQGSSGNPSQGPKGAGSTKFSQKHAGIIHEEKKTLKREHAHEKGTGEKIVTMVYFFSFLLAGVTFAVDLLRRTKCTCVLFDESEIYALLQRL